MNHAILLISCPDQKGITATVTNFIFQNNGNIVHADQHIDNQTNIFFMRIEWSLDHFKIEQGQIQNAFQSIGEKFAMKWELHFSDRKDRLAIFTSQHLHCLYDLLFRYKAGHLPCEIPLIISNHPEAQSVAQEFRIPFYEFPIEKENKREQEKREMDLLKKENIDTVVLARYHQILTPSFVEAFPNRIINIHHSFLPAFIGQNPYRQAFQRGVKIIGATSHYVTAELDEGPIIEQDIVRISHRHTLEDLIREGEDLEKVVLGRAVRWHLQKKILCYGNKTVVFD